MMIQELCPVRNVVQVAQGVFVLTCISPRIAASILPGQFVNIRIGTGTEPLLRRPFSVYRTNGCDIEIVFQVVGQGTDMLRHLGEADRVDVLGPLGTPYRYESPDFETAVLVAGGLGIAPLPILTSFLKRAGKPVVSFIGARESALLVDLHLEQVSVATDDGTRGFHGTVVDLARSHLRSGHFAHPKIFSCGPTRMLASTARLAKEFGIPCEVSLEGPMGCGFGICQGCPVELLAGERKYALMCKEGPVFDASTILM